MRKIKSQFNLKMFDRRDINTGFILPFDFKQLDLSTEHEDKYYDIIINGGNNEIIVIH